MIKKLTFYCLLFGFTMMACNNEEPMGDLVQSDILDCGALVPALIDMDLEILKSILDPELAKITLLDQDNDSCAFTNKLNAFQDLIDEACSDLDATTYCCSCVETFPTMTEMIIIVDSDGVETERVLDLLDPIEADGVLTVSGIH